MTLEVEVENRSGFEVDVDAARLAIVRTLAAEGVEDGEVGLQLVGAGEMAALNAAHRGCDGVTDVLSFPVDGAEDLPVGLPRQVGDLVVCPEYARQAGEPLELLIVHGALHLAGHDHETDDGHMLRRQRELVEEVEPVASRPS
jgi:probable rRNA maturation factor